MSGFSKGELKNLLRQASEPQFRKLLCAINASSGGGSAITIQNLCSTITGDLVGYSVISFDSATSTTTVEFFDDAWLPLGGAPANSGKCAEETIAVMTRCLCDDTLGDGTVIVHFTQFYYIDVPTGNIIVIDNKIPDLSADYTPSAGGANIGECDSLVPMAQQTYNYVSLTGPATYNPPSTVSSLRMGVALVNDPLTPPTLDTGAGSQPLHQGFSGEWDQGDPIINGTFIVTIPAGDVIAFDLVTLN
jgi:hypothetical protein